jgi:hypothetical protein
MRTLPGKISWIITKNRDLSLKSTSFKGSLYLLSQRRRWMVHDHQSHSRYLHTSFCPSCSHFQCLVYGCNAQCARMRSRPIQSEMTSHYISNAMATSAALSNHIEQEIIYKMLQEGPSDIALAIRPGKSFAKPKKICGNPNCKCTGHTTPKCFQLKGAMEGRKDKVLSTKAKAREEQNRSNPRTNPNLAGIQHDNSGCAYIVNSETGEAILLAAAEIDLDVALTALSTDPILKAWYGSMSAADQY